MLGGSLKLLSGSSHAELSQLIAQKIAQPLGALRSTRFSNGETLVTVVDSVRDQDLFIIQTAAEPVNDLLMELLITINACKIASARKITAVLPCFPYARQDKKDRSRAPITAKLVANMLESAGCNHVITMDLHASQIQGFFNIPVDKAAVIADKLKIDFALIHKERKVANRVSRMILVGNVTGKTAIIIDDIADTCGTLALAATILTDNGAEKCIALVTHAFLSGKAIQVVENSVLDQVVVSNTIPLSEEAKGCTKLHTMDISGVFAEAVRRTHNGESISQLFS